MAGARCPLQVTFLAGLPAFKGLNAQYLRALSHCFHQVTFEPREVVVQQGSVADSMFVLKSGQVSSSSPGHHMQVRQPQGPCTTRLESWLDACSASSGCACQVGQSSTDAACADACTTRLELWLCRMQVCVLIDPHLTLAEGGCSSEDGGPVPRGPAGSEGGADPAPPATDLDTKKLVQVGADRETASSLMLGAKALAVQRPVLTHVLPAAMSQPCVLLLCVRMCRCASLGVAPSLETCLCGTLAGPPPGALQPWWPSLSW